MKCLEKLLLSTILPVVTSQLDPLQSAYKATTGTEDVVACLIHLVLQQLDSPGNFVRIIFVDFSSDFSSAFSTIQKHLTIQKLHQLNTLTRLIHLIYNFLSDRLQTVCVGTTTSSVITTNTSLQGCVLSPFLYTLYTNDCITTSPNTTYLKYSDDTAILALLTDGDDTVEKIFLSGDNKV